MCDKYDNMRNHMFNLGGPMTYTNEAFIVEYDHVRFAGYESSENIYFEIDESTLKPTGKYNLFINYQCEMCIVIFLFV